MKLVYSLTIVLSIDLPIYYDIFDYRQRRKSKFMNLDG